jgi:hypothetical protein
MAGRSRPRSRVHNRAGRPRTRAAGVRCLTVAVAAHYTGRPRTCQPLAFSPQPRSTTSEPADG